MGVEFYKVGKVTSDEVFEKVVKGFGNNEGIDPEVVNILEKILMIRIFCPAPHQMYIQPFPYTSSALYHLITSLGTK